MSSSLKKKIKKMTSKVDKNKEKKKTIKIHKKEKSIKK